MLITEKSIVKINKKNIEHFVLKGYKCNLGEEIEVLTTDLTVGSRGEVEYSCDYCGVIKLTPYKEYLSNISGIVHKNSCIQCKGKKTIESNLIKYGVRAVSELEEVKERVRRTNKERYGVDYYNQTEECKRKTAETNMKRYGVKTTLLDSVTQNKIKNTLMKNYGVDHPSKSSEIVEKRHKTFIDRFGVDNPSQLESIKAKKKDTFEKNWGMTAYGLGNEVIKNKARQTLQEKYGVNNPMKVNEIKEKAISTNIERYGVGNPMQNEAVKKKGQQTNLERYGKAYTSQVPEFRAKAARSFMENQTVCTSRQQKYIANLFGYPLNVSILYWNVDMYDEDNDIIWEYDGGGHSLGVKMGVEDIETYKYRQMVREKALREHGHRISRIVSSRDYLPSDEVLLQMLSDAQEYFENYPKHSWIEYNIDKSIIRNAEHKEGIEYHFGTLRKISKADIDSKVILQ